MLHQETKAKSPLNRATGAGRLALKVGKAQMSLVRLATRSKEEPTPLRILKYGLAFIVGFIGGTIVGRGPAKRSEVSLVAATVAKREASDTSSTTSTTSDS